MRMRTFEEMITYFNQTVSGMDIDRKYKMTLLGIVTALLQKHDEDVAEIIRCKDCRFYQDNNGGYPHMNCKWDANETPDEDDFCSGAERRTDEAD